MRLAASIEKNGYFWLPSEEEDALSGILKISQKGQVTLELMVPVEFPKATVQTPWAFSSDDDNISLDKIIGKVEGDEFVTLCQCEFLTPFSGLNTLQAAANGPVSLQPSKFTVQYAIIGRNYFKKEEEICFSRCKVFFKGLEELLNTGSINVKYPSLNRVTMEYNRPDPVSFKIPYESNKIELTLNFHPSNFSFIPGNEFAIKQSIYISLLSNEYLSFDRCRDIIWRINQFLCLAIDKPVSFESATIFSREKLERIGDEEQEIPMKLYFDGNSRPEIETEISRTTCLFFYKANEIKEFVCNLICWMQNYEKYDIPINLYFASIHGRWNIEPRFLSLVQGIEVFHRQLKNREKRLDERIREMTEEFKDNFFADNTKREIFAQNVREERNWLTHYDKAKSPFMKEGNIKGFVELNWKLEALFQLHLMKLAGMKMERIKEIVKRNYRLRNKLGLLSDKETA